MERGKLFIQENEIGKPKVVFNTANGTVWLSEYEIANLFGCYSVAIRKKIRAILKSGVLRESDVCCGAYYANSGCRDLYNLEMITALAFRINSRNSEVFRNWLMRRVCSKSHFIIEKLCDERRICSN
jgi:hypothetical protein